MSGGSAHAVRKSIALPGYHRHRMADLPAIPSAARVGMEHWTADLAWALATERLTWRLTAPDGATVRFLKVLPLGEELTLSAERDRMLWLAGRLTVPTVLAYGDDGACEWLLTAGLPGADATSPALRAEPTRLVPLLADGLRQIHALPIHDCPYDSRTDLLVRTARARVAAGLVDPARDLKRDHGALTVATALARLAELRPADEDLVLCHGDYCLPNVLIRDGQVSGILDLGKLGVTDRWWDLAVATWSVTRNLGPGWDELFLEAYGAPRDPRRQAFFRLLYDLLP